MTILASLVGSAASIRQILLHIVPPDLGYGPPSLACTSIREVLRSTLPGESEGLMGEIGGFDESSLVDDHGNLDF